MPIHTDCATFLRATYADLPGGGLRSGHAHEIVAAYFGYSDGSALRAEVTYPLSAASDAEFLIPNTPRMTTRFTQLDLPAGFPPARDVAAALTSLLESEGHFSGKVWYPEDLSDHVNEYMQENASTVEEALSGEMASTNAYFDEIYVEEVSEHWGTDTLTIAVSGSFNGENDPDKPFSGTSISFETLMTFPRVAGRVFVGQPELDTGGTVDDKDVRDPDDM